MRKKIISVLQYMLFLGLGVFLIWFQFKDMSPADRQSFFDALRQANYWVVPVIVVMSLASHLSRAQRWRIMMEPMGFKPRLSNTFCVTMVGYMANAAVPRLGEVLKCTFLSKYERIPADKLVGTIIVERMFDLICFLTFIGLTVIVEFDTVERYLADKVSSGTGQGFNWTKLAIIVGSIIIVVLITRFLLKTYKDNKVVARFSKIVSGIKEGFLTVKNLKRRWAFLGHTLFIWTMYLMQIYVGYQAMEAVAGLSIGSSMALLTLASFAMIITPGGIGAFPTAIGGILVLYNVPKEPSGLAFGWLMWGVSTLIVVIGGIISLLVLPYLNKNKHAQGQHHPGQDLRTSATA